MSDYISRQAAIDAILQSAGTSSAAKAVSVLPSAPVTEVIRCKDCMFLNNNNDYCIKVGFWRKENDFCSRAERRNDGEIH